MAHKYELLNNISVVVAAVVVEVVVDLVIAIDLLHAEDLEVLPDMTVTVVLDHAVVKIFQNCLV